jgi:hypothetical protein
MKRILGRSLELYYIDGRPDGMFTAEMFDWTGHVLMTPRTQIAQALTRSEARYAGVYILIGEQDGQPRAYVGEGEDISARIRSHDVSKEWWTSAVLVTAASNKLNKAHVRYLEARLIAEARSIGRVFLENGTNPVPAALSEADVAKMETFLVNLFIVLPAVRVDMFIQRSRPALRTSASVPVDQSSGSTVLSDVSPIVEVRFALEARKHSIRATAVLKDGEFIVQSGSMARLRWEGSNGLADTYAPLHAELVRSGVLVPQGDHCVFSENYAFSSTSAAAAVVHGRPASGPLAWRLESGGMLYKDWESSQLAATAEVEV